MFRLQPAAMVLMAGLFLFTPPAYANDPYDFEYGTLSITNKDCGDHEFHIYAGEDSCTVEEDYVISDGTSDGLTVIKQYKKDVNYNGYQFPDTKVCTYAVEAVGEIAGGFQYSDGDSVTCEMKATLLWKQCRCN